MKGLQKKSVETRRGTCLATSVYASNSVGDTEIPLQAKTAVLPNGLHKLTIVLGAGIKPHCSFFQKK
jgi:hypothetical protein